MTIIHSPNIVVFPSMDPYVTQGSAKGLTEPKPVAGHYVGPAHHV